MIRIQRRDANGRRTLSASTILIPTIPAHWSPTDLADAHWLGCSYVITSVEKGKAAVTNSFELAGSDEGDKRLVEDSEGAWCEKLMLTTFHIENLQRTGKDVSLTRAC